MSNYLDLIELMEYPCDYRVKLGIMWIHPHTLPKKLIDLGNFEFGFYKMPDLYTNYTYITGEKLKDPITVPIISFSDDLFQDNVEIIDLVLSNYVSSLPEGAFKGMTYLRRIWIPKSIKYIPKDCFKECYDLEEIYYEGSEEEFKQIEIYHKLYKVIPRPGIKDDIIEYYDNGNLPFIHAKVFYNQVRDKEKIKETFVKVGNKDITDYIKCY